MIAPNRKPIMPNKNNKPSLSAVKTQSALAAFKNFSKAVKMPPVTANDRIKMQTALTAFKKEIQKTKEAAAKVAVGKPLVQLPAPLVPGVPVPPAPLPSDPGALRPMTYPAAQLAAQQTLIGTQLPSICNFLPPEVKPADITFAAAIESMQDTIAQIDILITNPVAGGGGYLLGKEFLPNNFKDR